MDFEKVISTTQNALLESSMFPYDTGQLHDNFVDKDSTIIGEKSASFTVLSNPLVFYGKILEVAPAIRYRLRKVSKGSYSYIKHNNRHFRYIERIIESDVIPAIENELGVKYVK